MPGCPRSSFPAASAVLTACLALMPAVAGAGGFEHPDNGARAVGRGGAFTVGADDPTALHHNPGALARLRGTRFLWHHNLVFHDTSFQRAPLDPGWAEYLGDGTTLPRFGVEEDRHDLFALGGFVAATSDLGLDDWTFGLGVYGPSAVGSHEYPAYGQTSFMLTEMDVLLVYYTAAAAWQIPDTFGVGVALQYVDLPTLEYSLVIDAATTPDLDPVPRAAGATQLEAKLDLEDRSGFTAQIGAWWRPVRYLEIGAAGRVIPVELDARGGVTVDKPELVTDEVTARMPLTLPATARGGVRYLHERDGRLVFDVELDVHWENWSALDAYDVALDGRINGLEVNDLRIPKRWKDTVSIRLGGDWHVLPDTLTVRAGGFWESATVPENYTHVDFPAFERFGLGGGFTVALGRVTLTAAYLHVFVDEHQVDERYGKYFQQRPLKPCPADCRGLSGVVANAGTVRTSLDIVSIGAEATFDWLD